MRAFLGSLPCIHVIKLLLDFCPVNLSHVYLIHTAARRTQKGREKFLPPDSVKYYTHVESEKIIKMFITVDAG